MLRRSTLGAAAAALVAAGLLAGCGGAHAHTGQASGTSTTSRPAAPTSSVLSPTTTAPGGATARTAPAGPTTRYADVASADAAAYAADAWCNPLMEASGHSLVALEDDAESGTGQLAPLSTPAMTQALEPALGQVDVSPTARPSDLTDMATATAIVPVSVNPGVVTLHTAYCVAAPQPLTGYQVTAQGGTDVVDMEAAYSLTTGGHVTRWHLWWQPTLSYTPCGQNVCLDNWMVPGSQLLYWAAQQRSSAPEFVVPAPDGAWRLSYPPS